MPVRLVLVHSPLVGAGTWRPLEPLLTEGGYQVSVPDLTSSVADGPPYWSRQVEMISDSVQDHAVILVGHSGAGPLLAGAGDGLDQVQGYVFVDAGLPTMGQSWMEVVPPQLAALVRDMANDEGWLPPWCDWWSADELAGLLPGTDLRTQFIEDCPRLPLAMFEEVQPGVPGWTNAPGAYLRLSEAYDDAAAQAKTLGWPTIELASDHLAVFSNPELVVDPLMELVDSLQR